MITALGRFLRKLRIDRNEILKDMADKLEVAVSFLSAVENGKKRMPAEWNQKISNLYNFSDKQNAEFSSAIADSENKIELDLTNITNGKDFVISFARELPQLNDKQINSIAERFKEILANK